MSPSDGPVATPAELRLDEALAQAPLIAILRGLRGEEALAVVQALYSAGVRVAEVPLNSPSPFATIALLVQHFGDRMVIGGGTVIELAQVGRLAECGARLCVSPNTDRDIIAEARRLGLAPVPGFETPTEAFAALAAGARHLKFYPAAGRAGELKAMMAVLPRYAQITAVGGVTPRDVPMMFDAGARAFGVGSDVYQPGILPDAVRRRAEVWIAACKQGRARPRAALAANPQAAIGESPVWRPDGGRLTWVDPVRRHLHSADDQGGVTTLPMNASVCALASLPSGGLAGVLEDGFCMVDEANGWAERRSTAQLAPGCRFNDMCVDPAGGLWVGAMHKGLLAARGSLYYAASIDATPVEVASGLGVPNGMAFDAEGERLFVIDTLSRNLIAYPANLRDGSLGEPVIVTDFMGIPGKPDGMARATDGSFWVAMWGGGCVVQIAADGAWLETVKVPAPHVSSVCVDPDGRLWITTSRMRLSEPQLSDAPASGALFIVVPEIS
jgi:Entner-Doudoroff aldolase